MPKRKASRAKSLGHWSTAGGDLEFEARIFDEGGELGTEIVVVDVEGRVEVVLAVGKKELNQVITILESARCQLDVLPEHLQKSPDEEEEDVEDPEEDLDEEEETEEADA